MSGNHFCIVCEKWVGFDDCAPGEGGTARVACVRCLADAKLGRLVRKMPSLYALWKDARCSNKSQWWAEPAGVSDEPVSGQTPEEALERAMGEAK